MRAASPSWTDPIDAEPPGPSSVGVFALARAVAGAASTYRWRLAICLAVPVAGAALLAGLTPLRYTATVTLLLEAGSRAPAAVSAGTTEQRLDDGQTETELQVIRSDTLLAKVFESLALDHEPDIVAPPPTPTQLLGTLILSALPGAAEPDVEALQGRAAFATFKARVGAERVGLSRLVRVTFAASTPALAKRVSAAVASAYVWQSVAAKAAVVAARGAAPRSRLAALAAETTAAETAIASGPLPPDATPDADARVLGTDPEPLRPSAPRSGPMGALGAVLGLLGGSLSVLHALTSRRIRRSAALARSLGLPCLATLPDCGPLAAGRLAPPVDAAIRGLAAALARAVAVEGDARVRVALVAWTPGAGCQPLAVALADVLRKDGARAPLVDSALLRPPFLSRAVPFDGPAFLRALDDVHPRGLLLMPLPPLRDNPDSALVAGAADAVVIVAAAGSSTTDDMAEARRALAGAKLLGAVLNSSGT